MTSPFRKRKYTTLGAGLVLGTVAAGVAGYLFYSKNKPEVRNMLAGKIDQLRLKFFPQQQPAEADNHTSDYMEHHHTKAPKTDREKLLKGEILDAGHSDAAVNG